MYNLAISFAVGAVLFGLVLLAGFSPWAAVIPAVLGFLVTNVLLARRIGKRIQDLATAAQKEIQAQRIDKGIKLLEEGFRYEKWQLLVGAELHANIGILHYVKKDFDAARPHLEKAAARGPAGGRAKAMLACIHYQAKDAAAMSAAFEQSVKAAKKDALHWAAYAWCLDKQNRRDDAIRVLARGVETNPADERLKASMVALQNEKKLKMRAYAPDWYQFHLEKPPPDLMGGPGGRRVVFRG